ncbi:MAG: hypothetical protein HQ553_17810 [Chloroflexi bacterium]|nr:hypothetical protein [Chloroflexota bacterium]
MKKLFFFGLIVVPALATALLWVLITDGISCLKDSSDVTVTVKKITLSEVSFATSTVEVSVQVENDNVVGATLERIEYDIYLGSKDKWIWLGRGERGALDIGASDVEDFLVTTIIDNSQLVDVITGRILGGEPTEMKVDGRAWFKVGTVSVEVEFDAKDIDPYKPLLEDENIITEPVESGTEGEISE